MKRRNACQREKGTDTILAIVCANVCCVPCPTQDFIGNNGARNQDSASIFSRFFGTGNFGGGAVLIEDGSEVTVDVCKFINNTGFGGGAIESVSPLTEITRSVFHDNAALPAPSIGIGGAGGALHLINTQTSTVPGVLLGANRFVSNSAASVGGAIKAEGPIDVDRCFFGLNR